MEPTSTKEPPSAENSHLGITTILVLLANPVARSGPTPEALTPTSTPVPTAAAMPTEKPAAAPAASSKVPEPAKTPTPAGKLAPLRLRNSKALHSLYQTPNSIASATVRETGPTIYRAGPSIQEEQGKLIGCFNGETLARIFLTGFVPGSEPLSEITSDCFRAAFEVTEGRS